MRCSTAANQVREAIAELLPHAWPRSGCLDSVLADKPMRQRCFLLNVFGRSFQEFADHLFRQIGCKKGASGKRDLMRGLLRHPVVQTCGGPSNSSSGQSPGLSRIVLQPRRVVGSGQRLRDSVLGHQPAASPRRLFRVQLRAFGKAAFARNRLRLTSDATKATPLLLASSVSHVSLCKDEFAHFREPIHKKAAPYGPWRVRCLRRDFFQLEATDRSWYERRLNKRQNII